MDASELARVRYHVREDAWTAWALLVPDAAERETLLELALTTEGDLRGVAAYLLETVCSDARVQAASAPAGAKKIKVGPIELERQQGNPVTTVQADGWCARAATLRAQVFQGGRRRGSVAIPVEVSF